MVTVGEALRAAAIGEREARALLALALGSTREFLIAHPEQALTDSAASVFQRLIGDRQRGMPMAYLLGEQEFFGLAFSVGPDVLIPRPETELLVGTALEYLQGRIGARVLELGTGCGCIAIALERARPDLWILATEQSGAALARAQENCQRLQANVRLLGAHWYEPIAARFDLIVSNPPYIAAGDPHLAQLEFEPRIALTDEGDGLAALRTIIAGARGKLRPDGHLLVEHGYDQGAAVRALMAASGLHDVQTLRDLAGQERVCRAIARAAV